MFSQYKQFISKPSTHVWRKWWATQTPSRQDRFAFLAPLMAVLVFMVAITSVFWYLKYEEIDREQEIVRRDVEYALVPPHRGIHANLPCPASTTFPCQRQLFLPIDDNYSLGKAALAA